MSATRKPAHDLIKDTSLPAPTDAPASRILHIIVVLAIFFCLSAFSHEVSDSDFWWHLRTGQFIAQTHALPNPDPFAYTTSTAGSAYPGEATLRRFNLTHEWLYQVLVYLAYAAAGMFGVVMLRALALTAICGIVGWLTYLRTSGFYRALLAGLACASVASTFAVDRPFGISFLFLAFVIAILDSRRWVWSLPVVFLVWANLHGGYFIGWVPLGAYSAAAIFARWRGRPEPGDRRLWAACVVSVAASGLNPNFYDSLRVVWLYRQSVLQSRVWEWQPTPLLPPTPFVVILFAAAAILLLAWRRVRLSDWLLFVAFAAASLMAVRNTLLIGILGPLLIATYTPWIPKARRLMHWAAAALLLGGAGAEFAMGRAFQFHANTWRYPAGAAKFLEEHGIRGRLFNDYTDGGYWIWRLWPFQRVFIDGRALSDQLYLDFANIATNIGDSPGRNADDLLKHYGIEVIALSAFEYQAGTLYLIVPALSAPNQSEWKLVYLDDVTSVFVKSPPPGVTPIRLPNLMTGVERQCRYHISQDPSTPLCAKTLGFQFLRFNSAYLARQWFATYLNYKPDDAEALTTYRALLQQRNR